MVVVPRWMKSPVSISLHWEQEFEELRQGVSCEK
jgi:hypothetical protein